MRTRHVIAGLDPKRFKRRVWVTRPRPGIDRMSAAWLIRRFIDPQARFTFSAKPPTHGRASPFDMYGVEFGHSQHGCTFETLVARFELASPTLARIGRIIHDLDLKESRHAEAEAPRSGRPSKVSARCTRATAIFSIRA